MTTREADPPLRRHWEARGRSAPLPTSYTTTRDTTHRSRENHMIDVSGSTIERKQRDDRA